MNKEPFYLKKFDIIQVPLTDKVLICHDIIDNIISKHYAILLLSISMLHQSGEVRMWKGSHPPLTPSGVDLRSLYLWRGVAVAGARGLAPYRGVAWLGDTCGEGSRVLRPRRPRPVPGGRMITSPPSFSFAERRIGQGPGPWRNSAKCLVSDASFSSRRRRSRRRGGPGVSEDPGLKP